MTEVRVKHKIAEMKTGRIVFQIRDQDILFFVLFFISLVLHPWRDSLSQDDAVYAWASIHWNGLSSGVHPAQLAAAWPQILGGAILLKWLPAQHSLAILNTFTWTIFIGLVAWVKKMTRHSSILILSFFLFPLWIQYGASFLSDIYAGFFLVAILALVPHSLFIVAASLGLILQRQTMAAFPFFWGLSLLGIKSELRMNRTSFCLLGGSLLGIALSLAFPTTPLQKGFAYWRWVEWASSNRILDHVSDYFIRLIQMMLGLGLFLIPFAHLKKIRIAWIIFVQLVVFLGLWFSPARPMSAGIFFTNYFPREIGLILNSFGVIGWTAFFRLRPYRGISPYATVLACWVIISFYIFQEANDIRYMMILSLPFLFHIPSDLPQNQKCLGTNQSYFLGVLFLSLILNQYNLNTTEKRWSIAADLEKEGVSVRDISAGYGHDFFYLGAECFNRIFKKIQGKHPVNPIQSLEFYQTFIQGQRYFEEGWRSRYTIKPGKAFGYNIGLPGVGFLSKEAETFETFPYTVFGIPNEMIVIRRTGARVATCFSAE